MKKIRTLIKYARGIASTAKKKAKPMARKILDESIKLERVMEAEAKKVLRDNKPKRKKAKRKH
jgi:anti-sigma factor ChrR (cupin superfamily)